LLRQKCGAQIARAFSGDGLTWFGQQIAQ